MTATQNKQIKLPAGLEFLRTLPMPRKIGLLGRLYGPLLEKHGVTWVKTSPGPIWKLDLRNMTHRWIVLGEYEGPGLISWAKQWLHEDSVVVDSGANIGQVLLYLAPIIRTGEYIAVEPHPVARGWLKECLCRNSGWKVRVEEFGFGEKSARASLEGQWGEDLAVGSQTELHVGDGEIEIKKFDDYAEARGIQKIDLWKMDMEGAEEAALRGAERMLASQAIRALVLETESGRFEGMAKFLARHKYKPLEWDGSKINRVVSHRNVLFVAQ